MANFDKQYIDLCKKILDHGEHITNYGLNSSTCMPKNQAIPEHTAQALSSARTIRLPHQVMQFDLSKEFPLITIRPISLEKAVDEILWKDHND